MVYLTIITPVFNGRLFIEKCLQNVLDQKCPNVEHLVMDGGSTDGTVEIVSEWSRRYGHIRLISEKDKGQSDAMNKGIRLSKGQIISFLNVDDFYEAGALNRALEHFSGLPEPAFLCGNLNIWNSDGSFRHFNKPSRLSLVELVSNKFEWPYNPSAYFYHKSIHEIVGYYNEDEHFVMDYDFILRVARVIQIQYVDETWGNFCVVEGSKTLHQMANNLDQAFLAGERLRQRAQASFSDSEQKQLSSLLAAENSNPVRPGFWTRLLSKIKRFT